jgi:hypothetical protein
MLITGCGGDAGSGETGGGTPTPTPDAAPAPTPTPDAHVTPERHDAAVTPGTQDAAPEPTPDAAPAPSPDAAPEPTPDAALEPTADAAPGPTPDAALEPTPDAIAPPPGPVLGPPIDAPADRWTWVDFPDSTCNDGSPTGIAVRPGDGPGVVVYLNGGGLCWDAQTCVVLHTSTSGPFGGAQFAQMAPAFEGTILDPTAAGNPFRGWSYVFVPYCTGDGHTGDRRQTYDAQANAAPVEFNHTGARNLDLFMSRVAATFAAPESFALIGPSAGGLGALVNYAHVRDYWRDGTGFVWSDGFPLLGGDALPDPLQAAWDAAWGLDARLDALCPTCAADPAQVLTALAARYPGDRFALSGTTRDGVLPPGFGLTVEAYTAAFEAARRDVYAAAPNVGTFVVDGAQHTLMLRPDTVRSGGTTLAAWLERMLAGDAGWDDVGP